MTSLGRVAAGVGISAVAACTAPPRDGGGPARPGAGEAVAVTRRCDAPPLPAGLVQVERDVPYVTRGGTALHFDVAWSDGGPPAPLVLLLHGGSWSGGGRENLDEEMLALARRGFTAATVQYRLTEAPRNVFPAAAADVRCALRDLRRRAGTYHIALGRVGVMGYSAGGHLASLLGTGADLVELEEGGCGAPDDSVRVQAVVSYAGPQDLRVNGPYTREQAEIVTNFLGIFPGDHPTLATLASPIAHVSTGDPPFLLIHGTDDDLVPVSHARRMAGALKEVGTPASILELRGAGHEFAGFTGSRNPVIRCSVAAFLDRWLVQDSP